MIGYSMIVWSVTVSCIDKQPRNLPIINDEIYEEEQYNMIDRSVFAAGMK
jgi:hypothetical protein